MSNRTFSPANRKKNYMGRHHVGAYIVLVIGAIIMILPFLWMVLTSFKTYSESIAVPIQWLPSRLNFDAYTETISKLNLLTYYKNTMIVTFFSVIGQVSICAIAAYAFARIRFPGRDVIFLLVLASMLIPGQMTLIPKYIMCADLGLINRLAGIVIPNLFNAYGVFFLRQFFMTLPRSLEESARLDGCSYFRIFWNIMLPLCKSGLAAFAILTLMGSWNDLLWPLIITSADSQRVLAVGIACLQGEHMSDYPTMMAASMLATLPLIVAFIIGQKWFIASIATSGIKM